jgi:ketosteroid isomerase-like protein
MSKTETIKAVYEAFGRRDVPAIVALCASDVDWNNSRVHSNEVPWNGNFSGTARLPGFFAAVGNNLDFTVFNPHTFVEAGDDVIVMLRLESTLKKNGQPLVNDAIHAWKVDGSGKITSYRHYNDTAMELAAWRA